MMHRPWSSIVEVPYCFSRSNVKFQGHTALKIVKFDRNWAFLDSNSSLNSLMVMKCCTKLETAKERCPIVFQSHPSNFKVTRDKTSSLLTRIGRFRTIGRSQLSNPSDLPCLFWKHWALSALEHYFWFIHEYQFLNIEFINFHPLQHFRNTWYVFIHSYCIHGGGSFQQSSYQKELVMVFIFTYFYSVVIPAQGPHFVMFCCGNENKWNKQTHTPSLQDYIIDNASDVTLKDMGHIRAPSQYKDRLISVWWFPC